MEHIKELIAKYRDVVLEHYHWLHAHPELSGEEKESAAYIAAQLRKMGLNVEPVYTLQQAVDTLTALRGGNG